MRCTRLAANTGRKKSPFWHHRTTLFGCIFAAEACIDNQKKWKKNLLNSNTSSICPHNMVNFGLLTAEICWQVWGTPADFNGFRILAALLHGTLVVGVSQTLRHWTEGATYIWQGDHHVGHWPTFYSFFPRLISAVADWMSTILPHMVYGLSANLECVWNVLHSACWKYRTQKIAILAPSHNFVGLYHRS